MPELEKGLVHGDNLNFETAHFLALISNGMASTSLGSCQCNDQLQS